jgi:putative ABC transport system permease protein
MLKNYLKTVLRSMARRKLLSATMIFGLALGILSSFLLMIYVFNELSYDRSLPNSNRIYRIIDEFHKSWGNQQVAKCYGKWIDPIKDEYPEIAQMAKFNDSYNTPIITVNENKFKPENFFEADSTFFDVFQFNFIYGSASGALRYPKSIVLSRSTACKYFGSQNPIGRLLKTLDDDSNSFDYHISGVFQDAPINSHFHPEIIASWPSEQKRQEKGYYYVLLKQAKDAAELQAKLGEFVLRHLSPDEASGVSLYLQALTDIHLKSHLNRELEVNGNITQVCALFLVAVLILVITCINYINLSIARKTASMKELGVRRVLGADNRAMLIQNISESFMYIFISLFLVLLLFEPSLLVLEKYLNLKIGVGIWTYPELLSVFIIEIVLLCLVAGGYPTFVIRKTSSVDIMISGSHSATGHGQRLRGFFSRKILLVVQFSLAILLIAGVVIVVQQMYYVANVDLGYDSQQMIYLPEPTTVKERYNVLKKELLNQAGVTGVSACMQEPSVEIVDNCKVLAGGMSDDKQAPWSEILPVDKDFIKVMKMKLLAGSSFDTFIPTDIPVHKLQSPKDEQTYMESAERMYMLNEAAVKMLGWKSPQEAIGKQLRINQNWFHLKSGAVIGVVKDFHFISLHNKINPIVLFVEPQWLHDILIRISTNGIDGTLSNIKQVWNRINPEYPFNYKFVSDVFAAKYIADNQFKIVMELFSCIAIVIACIGLLSVSLFTTERRIKEIGIRKVLGASVLEIVIILTIDLTKWIILANIIAWPAAYYFMNKWLQGFAYHIVIQLWVFVLSGAFVLVIALMTVSWQAMKAATANPVESLRYE